MLTHIPPASRDNLLSASEKVPPSPSLMETPRRASPQPAPSPLSPLFSFLLSRLSHLLHRGFQLCLSGWLGTSQMTNCAHHRCQRQPCPVPSPSTPPWAARPSQDGGKRGASPNSLLFHLFHLLSTSNHPVDDFLLLICQLFLFPLSVWLTAGVDRPSCLEPER